MTRDDIILMAREAGFAEWAGTDDVHFLAVIERFAELVAAAERDRLCKKFNVPKELAHEKAKSNETSRAKVLGES